MMHDTITDAFNGMTNALVNFTETGKLHLKDFADTFVADMMRMEIEAAESKLLSAITTGLDFNFMGGFANGGIVNSSGPVRFADGGVVTEPTLFKFANGTGLMGEAGAEAIVPLPDGRSIPVTMSDALGPRGAPQVVVNITNKGQAVQAQQTGVRQQGNTTIVDMVINAISGDIAGGGKTAKALQQRYGLSRRGVPSGT